MPFFYVPPRHAHTQGWRELADALYEAGIDGRYAEFLDEELLAKQFGMTDPGPRRRAMQWLISMRGEL